MSKKHPHFSIAIKRCSYLAFCAMAILTFLTFGSCNGNSGHGVFSNSSKHDSCFVINEIMVSNHSGITDSKGKLHDWIEIKNVSNQKASLKGFSVTMEKKSRKEGSKGEVKKKTWNFPDVEVEPGKCLVVFASKKGKKKSDEDDENDSENDAENAETKKDGSELHASFKLPSTGAKLSLMHDTMVVSQVTYNPLESDQCYRRLGNDTTFETSYEPTPGFDNTREGYEQYNKALEKKRDGALRLWELHSYGHYGGKAWVEIKNVSSQPVALKDYCLATSKKDMSKYQLPDVTLQPGELYVVHSRKGEFKISSSKSVMLTHNGKFVDGLCGSGARLGVSVGRVDGKEGIFYFAEPTPGSENSGAHYRFIAPKPSFDPTAGVYDKDGGMTVTIKGDGYKVHYVVGGGTPSKDSPIYSEPIKIAKTTTIRAICEGDSSTLSSNTAMGTFIIDEPHTLAVINITVDSADLYDKTRGIYVNGPGYTNEYPHYGANYWKRMWKQAHVEYIDNIPGQEGFSVDCELAIFGGFSRALAKKSFKIRFKNDRGPSQVTYDFFGNGNPVKLKNFVLRSGSQDISGAMIRDEYFTSLMQENSPNLLTQAYRPVALYINGEYFGLYYIREKIDDDFVARHLDVSNDSVTIMMSGLYCEGGSKAPYNQLISYIKENDLTKPEHYNYVKDRFDLEGLIDCKLGEIYSGKVDAGNVRYVLSQDPAGDGKWHVVFYDIDASWGCLNSPRPISFHLKLEGTSVVRAVNTITHYLLGNNEFRTLFLERLSHHMHTTFTNKNVTTRFDELIKTITPEMERNCKRWPDVLSYSSWERNVEKFRSLFKDRDKNMLNAIREELNITDEENKKYFGDLGF